MLQEGLLLVVSGPSGAGKGTVLGNLRQSNPNVRYSVSATTRQPREGEVEGKNYFFKSFDEFQRMIRDEELIEWVCYCNNYYGTPKKSIEESIRQGIDIVLEIEVEGALNIKSIYPESVLIFILPPSFEELGRRIEGRGTEKPDIIKQRLDKAKKELDYIGRYDYIIVNNTVHEAIEDINSIIRAEKLKQFRNKKRLKQMGL